MKRRDFIALLGGGAVAWPLAVHAQQQSAKIARIGYLTFGTAAAAAPRVDAMRAGLRDLGYVEGKNILIEFRWAERVELLHELAAELAHSNVDIIFATSSTEVEPARQATKTIPIVFATHADPVGLGHVTSLPRPRWKHHRAGRPAIRSGRQAPGDFQGSSAARYTVRRALEYYSTLIPYRPASDRTCQQDAWGTPPNDPGYSCRRLRWGIGNDGTGTKRRCLCPRVGADDPIAFSASGRARVEVSTANHLRLERKCGDRRPHELRAGPHRSDSARRYLHRQDSQGCQTRRLAGGAGVQISAGHQSQDCQSARPRNSAHAARARRRGDRVM